MTMKLLAPFCSRKYRLKLASPDAGVSSAPEMTSIRFAQLCSSAKRASLAALEFLISCLRNALKRLKNYAKVANKVTNENA
jgi:hypothetical protein